jgi:hypothetical protein
MKSIKPGVMAAIDSDEVMAVNAAVMEAFDLAWVEALD